MNATQTKKDVYSIATEQVLRHLERGKVPWLISFTDAGMPQNLINRRPYRGINSLLLAALGYSKNVFLTPKQIETEGGHVKDGEEGHIVFYWNWNGVKKGNGDDKPPSPQLRFYRVYNIIQCIGIKRKAPKVRKPRNPLEMCVAIVGNMPHCPAIRHGIAPPGYISTIDGIDIPHKEDFRNDELYYATLFRALIHSTGHESRLNRKEVMEATLTDLAYYSTEELIGEIGASYLASWAGIQYGETTEQSEYVNGWIEKFKRDTHLIVYASSHAQRAVDYILNRKYEE